MSDDRTKPPILAQLLATDTLQGPLREAVARLTDLATLRDQITSLQADHDALLWRVVELEAGMGHHIHTRSRPEPRQAVEDAHRRREALIGIELERLLQAQQRQEASRSRPAEAGGDKRAGWLIWGAQVFGSNRYDDHVCVDMHTTPFGSRAGAPGRHELEPALSRVSVPTVFAIHRVPITRAQWREVAGFSAPRGEDAPDDAPATGMTLLEVLWFCNRRSEQEGLRPCYTLDGLSGSPGANLNVRVVRFNGLGCDGYRLPTEPEWEAAARVGSWDERLADPDIACWHQGNSDDRLQAVALKAPNELGLYDMLGNTHELVWSDWRTLTPPSTLQNLFRGWAVCRSGSYSVPAQHQRFAGRWRVPALARRHGVGFRPVRTLEVRQS